MIRKVEKSDMKEVADIWLESNIEVHGFISADYWINQFNMVKELLESSEIYVYDDKNLERDNLSGEERIISGFIGMNENHVEGIFVKGAERSKGIGRALINYVKAVKGRLILNVYQKNERALMFYLREGFKVLEEQTDHATGEKELLMAWDKDTGTAYDDEWYNNKR